jgi:hypothetical protein
MGLLGHVRFGIDPHFPIYCFSYLERGYDDAMEDVRRLLDRYCCSHRSSILKHYVNWGHPVRQPQAHLCRSDGDLMAVPETDTMSSSR